MSSYWAPIVPGGGLAGGLAARPAAATFEAAATTTGPGISVLADSGQLAAGEYEIVCSVVTWGFAASSLVANVALQHRDAANAANIRSFVMGVASPLSGFSRYIRLPRITLALNERIRLAVVVGFAADVTIDFDLFVRLV